MKQNQQILKWLQLAIFVTVAWAAPQAPAAIITVTSVQTGNWEDTTTWDCGCAPTIGNAVVIASGTTVKVNATHVTGNVTVNGALDLNDQFFQVEGTSFANNGSVFSSTGSFGEIDFLGVGGAISTTQTISGTGSYAAPVSFPVEIHVINVTTLSPATGTVIDGVRNFFIQNSSTLSLTHTLVFQNGALNTEGGSILNGVGLQTKGTTTLSFSGATSALTEVFSGTTSGTGNFGPIAIDSGAALKQTGTIFARGDVTVNGSLDMNDQFLEFEGVTFANNNTVFSTTGSAGEVDFTGINGAVSTGQQISGTGTYAGAGSFPIDIHVINVTTLSPATGTVIGAVRNFFIQNSSTLALAHTFVFQNGAMTSEGGSTISGASPLQTKGTVSLSFSGTTTALTEVFSGTTSGTGNFGPITIDSGATLKQTGTIVARGDFTNNGGLDMNDQFLEFEGSTFANNNTVFSTTGSAGEVDFNGVNGAISTGQAISGTGTYAGGGSFPIDIHVINVTTLTPATGTVLGMVRLFFIQNGSTLALAHTLIFQNSAMSSEGGSTISGASALQTKGTTTLSFSGTTSALTEVFSGTSSGTGNFGPVTVDSGATLKQTGTGTFNGNLTVNGTMDMNNQFAVFQGTTFTNNGAMVSGTPFGIFDFNGVNGTASTAQNVAGTGTYNTNGRIDFRVLNTAQVAVVNGAALEGIVQYTVDAGCSFTNHGTIEPGFPPGTLTDNGPITLASNSTLAFAIGGTTAGTDYDVFNKIDGGTQTLDGTLSLTLTGGFVPANSDIFTIMTTQAMIAGTFTNVANGGRLNTTDGAGSFRVTWTVVNDAAMSRNITLSDFQPAVHMQQVATPVIVPHGGSFRKKVEVHITDATVGATIYYTINGGEPTTSSTRYTRSFRINGLGTFVVRAKAFKTGFTPSNTATETFFLHR